MSWRRMAAHVLVVLGALLGIASIYANFVRREALDTATFRRTSSELIANPTIREEVAATAVDQLYQNVDVQAELSGQLPESLQGLAGPLAGASRELAYRLAREALSRPAVQSVFVASSSAAQQELVRILDRRTTLLQAGDSVVLDMRPIMLRLGDRFGFVGNLADRVPQNAGRVTILRSGDLKTVQDVTRLLRAIADWIWVPMVAFWALAVWLAKGSRRRELEAIAAAFVVVGAVVVVVRSLAGTYLVDHVVASDSVRPAAREVWSILTDSLASAGWLVLVTGVIATVGLWLYGPAGKAAAARSRLAPYLRQPGPAWASFALLLVVFFRLAPATRFSFVLIVGVSAAAGFELLRRKTGSEHPDARPGGLLAGRRTHRQTREAGLERERARSTTEELERLAGLHTAGALTDREFETAKVKVLG